MLVRKPRMYLDKRLAGEIKRVFKYIKMVYFVDRNVIEKLPSGGS